MCKTLEFHFKTFQSPKSLQYSETELRVIERMSDKIKLCKWDPIHIGFGEVPNPSNEAVMCTLSKFPETNTMIFKADPLNPNADIDLPILLKDDPEIVPDKTTEAKRGYSSTIIIISKIMIKELWV